MARTTVFTYKGHQADPRKVGRELNVDAVLTGKVSQRSDRLTIQADLVNVADGSQLWGEQYSRKLADVTMLQQEIAKDISGQAAAEIEWR
jgi:TolB-like protein